MRTSTSRKAFSRQSLPSLELLVARRVAALAYTGSSCVRVASERSTCTAPRGQRRRRGASRCRRRRLHCSPQLLGVDHRSALAGTTRPLAGGRRRARPAGSHGRPRRRLRRLGAHGQQPLDCPGCRASCRAAMGEVEEPFCAGGPRGSAGGRGQQHGRRSCRVGAVRRPAPDRAGLPPLVGDREVEPRR